jgi:hypothetical protein
MLCKNEKDGCLFFSLFIILLKTKERKIMLIAHKKVKDLKSLVHTSRTLLPFLEGVTKIIILLLYSVSIHLSSIRPIQQQRTVVESRKSIGILSCSFRLHTQTTI